MITAPLHHDIPNPPFQRALLGAAGLFAIIIAPVELWRGVWPLNLTTPFFAFLILGAWSVGGAFVWAGLLTPAVDLRMDRESLTVDRTYLWGSTREVTPARMVTSIAVEVSTSSDGPDTYCAVIRTLRGGVYHSRPMGTRAAAENLVREFGDALGFTG
jgi:hypothetical protein